MRARRPCARGASPRGRDGCDGDSREPRRQCDRAAAGAGALVTPARARAVELVLHDGVTVVPPDALSTTTGGHYRVFTPYLRVWEARAEARPPRAADDALEPVAGIAAGRSADVGERCAGPSRRDPAWWRVGCTRTARPSGRATCSRATPTSATCWARGDLEALRRPALRVSLTARARAGGPRRRVRRARPAARVARFPSPAHVRGARSLDGGSATGLDSSLAARCRRARGVGGRSDRVSDRRRRDATAARGGLDARPRPNDRRDVPDEAPRS